MLGYCFVQFVYYRSHISVLIRSVGFKLDHRSCGLRAVAIDHRAVIFGLSSSDIDYRTVIFRLQTAVIGLNVSGSFTIVQIR